MVTVNEPDVPVLLWASATEQVSVVTPIGNFEPVLIGEQVPVVIVPSTRSVALIGSGSTLPVGSVVLATMFDGVVTVGGVVSVTVTVNDDAAETRPSTLVSVQLTVD